MTVREFIFDYLGIPAALMLAGMVVFTVIAICTISIGLMIPALLSGLAGMLSVKGY